MLILSRKTAEQVQIGDEIVVTVLSMHGSRVRLGFSAPREISIRRSELELRPGAEADEVLVPSSPNRQPR